MNEILSESVDFELLKSNLGADKLQLIEKIIISAEEESPPEEADSKIYGFVVDWCVGNIDAEALVEAVMLMEPRGGLLDKFGSIEIQNNTRLSEDDADFCMRQQALYENVLAHYRTMQERLQAIDEFDGEFYKSVSADNSYASGGYTYAIYKNDFFKFDREDLFKLILSVHNIFIKQLNKHFRDKYKISIDDKDAKTYLGLKEPKEPEQPYRFSGWTEEEREAYMKKNKEHKKAQKQYRENIINAKLHYDAIVDDIFLLLGGFSFGEQAENEIKADVLSAATKSNGEPDYSIKSKKISFDILYSYKCSIFKRYEVSLDGKGYQALLRALSYFDSDKRTASIYNRWLGDFVHYKKYEDDGIYDTHDAGGNKVISFKFYKNGKLEVEFIDHKTALTFAREYLGYREG